MRLSFASFTLQPPPQQTSPSPWPPAFPLPLRPSENGRGRVLAISTVFTRYLIQGQLHLCLRKVHPNIRHNPSWQYGYCKQYPPNARLLGQHMRLSFASFTLQPPLLQTSPSPWPPAFPLPLRPSEKERGPIKLCIRDFEFVSVKRIPSVRPAVVQLPLQFNFVGKGSDAYQTVHRDIS